MEALQRGIDGFFFLSLPVDFEILKDCIGVVEHLGCGDSLLTLGNEESHVMSSVSEIRAGVFGQS